MSELEPIPMLLWCPKCSNRHIDEEEFATKVHATHSCQFCGLTWRPAVIPTCGVLFLPGFKNDGVLSEEEMNALAALSIAERHAIVESYVRCLPKSGPKPE